jgi:predicted dehydrogenase
MDLRAVVLGSGWAAEGHSLALRAAGVSVEGIYGRNLASAESIAQRLGIPRASDSWERLLSDLRPDVVAVAVPAGAHPELIEGAIAQGSHLFCDKPLATTSAVAEQLYRRAQAAGIRHAYAATHRYDPSVVWLEELVSQGVIGTVTEVECHFRRPARPLAPWSWMDRVDLGGGLLHNALPHWLAILERVLGGQLRDVAGEVRVMRARAPFVPDLHDSRGRGKQAPTAEEAAGLEWRPCDSDGAFAALFRFATRDPLHLAHVVMSTTGQPAAFPPQGFCFHGTEGTLAAAGNFSYAVRLHRAGEPENRWHDLPVPDRLFAGYPTFGDEFQRKWTCLARAFAADLRGAPFDPYLTFRDGWRYQVAIDAIRRGAGWASIPQ